MVCRPLLPLLALAALLALPPACRALSCYYCQGVTGVQSGAVNLNATNLFSLRASSEPESVGSFYSCASFNMTLSKYKMDCEWPYDKSCGKNIAANGQTVMRGCANGAGHECTEFNDGTKQCLCTSDYCNSAGMTAPALLLLLPAALLAALYSRQ